MRARQTRKRKRKGDTLPKAASASLGSSSAPPTAPLGGVSNGVGHSAALMAADVGLVQHSPVTPTSPTANSYVATATLMKVPICD